MCRRLEESRLQTGLHGKASASSCSPGISLHEYGRRLSLERRVHHSVSARQYSPQRITTFADLVLDLDFCLMAVVHRPYVFLVVAALSGMGWTISASELWVASQRAMPDWARGRMNATMVMVAQAATALAGVIWGLAAHHTVIPVYPTIIPSGWGERPGFTCEEGHCRTIPTRVGRTAVIRFSCRCHLSGARKCHLRARPDGIGGIS
jgi:Transmembrane secretion effector